MAAFVFSTDPDCPLPSWPSCAHADKPHTVGRASLGFSQLLLQLCLYFRGSPCFELLSSISIHPSVDFFFPSLSLRPKGEGQPSSCKYQYQLCDFSLPSKLLSFSQPQFPHL